MLAVVSTWIVAACGWAMYVRGKHRLGNAALGTAMLMLSGFALWPHKAPQFDLTPAAMSAEYVGRSSSEGGSPPIYFPSLAAAERLGWRVAEVRKTETAVAETPEQEQRRQSPQCRPESR